jgi:hypothetical protein
MTNLCMQIEYQRTIISDSCILVLNPGHVLDIAQKLLYIIYRDIRHISAPQQGRCEPQMPVI